MSWQKYILTFLITVAIFGTAFYVANRLDSVRVADISATEQQVSLDILSNETQYDLLSELSCSQINNNSGLSDQLNTLATQLSVAEQNLGDTNAQVVSLKEQYSLLEIKDFILLQKIASRCNVHPVYILYFYSNSGDCPDCAAAGMVLTYLRETYPSLRIYSFDYHLETPALQTLIALYGIHPTLPAYLIDNKPPVYGLKTADDFQKIAPEISKLSTSSPSTNF